VGHPVIVKNLLKRPSYWLVPININQYVAGFIRIHLSSKIISVGTFYRDPGTIKNCPKVVTRITATEALRIAKEKISPKLGETAEDPIFVHDGPIGRETWLIEVIKNDTPIRWIFVTSDGTYERPAGTPIDKTSLK